MEPEWGLFGLFLSSFLASTILPLPSEAAVLFMLSNGNNSPWAILAVATFGNCLGGSTNYFLGQFVRKRWIKKTGTKAQHIASKYGPLAAALSWLPIIGDPILIALGIYRSRILPTFLFMFAGKFLRYLILVLSFLYLS
ncbi:hypothetical protein [Fluviicola sp.]|uniref:YqaA family protein n=1 Tax=Fluviicola sp. TaxID=1917219 RepID=UPI002617F64D|nr:hypothetical protein [Fluviicola sp.]